MKTLSVYSYDIKGKNPKFRDLEFWEIERDNLGLLGVQYSLDKDFVYISPDCLLDYIDFELNGIIIGTIWTYTIDEIKELLNNA